MSEAASVGLGIHSLVRNAARGRCFLRLTAVKHFRYHTPRPLLPKDISKAALSRLSCSREKHSSTVMRGHCLCVFETTQYLMHGMRILLQQSSPFLYETRYLLLLRVFFSLAESLIDVENIADTTHGPLLSKWMDKGHMVAAVLGNLETIPHWIYVRLVQGFDPIPTASINYAPSCSSFLSSSLSRKALLCEISKKANAYPIVFTFEIQQVLANVGDPPSASFETLEIKPHETRTPQSPLLHIFHHEITIQFGIAVRTRNETSDAVLPLTRLQNQRMNRLPLRNPMNPDA